MNAESLRRELQSRRPDRKLRRRRTLVTLAALGLVDAALMALHQFGVIRHLPDPPGFHSDEVVGSKAAYLPGTPDSTLYALQLSSVLALAGARRDRLLLADVLGGAVGALFYLGDMIFREKKACAYCIPAAAISLAMVAPALALLRDT
jgi:uncharacterized membrane protein